MKRELHRAFTTLVNTYGSHGVAATELGISRDHYCAIRNGRVNIPQRTAEYIILKASELETVSPPPSRPERCEEARA